MNIDELIEMEASMLPLIQQTKAALVAKIRNTPVPGVTTISGSVRCFTVQASTLTASRSWAAEYYSAGSQADIVEKALAKVSTATALKKKLTEMLENKSVRDSAANHILNDTTLGIISQAIN